MMAGYFFTRLRIELQQLSRNFAVLNIAIFAILLYAFFYPQPYTNQFAHDLPIAVVDMDQSRLSQTLIRRIDATESVAVTERYTSFAAAREAMAKRRVSGILYLPLNLAQQSTKGRSVVLTYYGDASYMLNMLDTATAISQAITAQNQEVASQRMIAAGMDPVNAHQASAFTITPVLLYNQQNSYLNFIAPPAFILILHQCLLISVCLRGVVGRHEPEQGTMTSIGEQALLFLLARFCVFLGLFSIHFWFYIWMLDVFYAIPNLGNLWRLAVLSVLMVGCVTMFGTCLSFLFRNMDGVFLTLVPYSIVLFFIAGLSWPAHLIPEALKFIVNFVPAPALMHAFVHLHLMGADFGQIQSQLLILITAVFGYGALAWYLLYRHILLNRKA